MYNLPYEDLHAPIAGPAHPFQKDGLAAGSKNHFSGHVEVSWTCTNGRVTHAQHSPMPTIALAPAYAHSCCMFFNHAPYRLSLWPMSYCLLVQDLHINPYIFEEQYHSFHAKGHGQVRVK